MSESDRSERGPEDTVSKDLEPILEDWEYKPGEVTARWIIDTQGRSMLQMRVALGVLQMHPDGRPDGHKPNGFVSLLEYHEQRLQDHFDRNKTTDGFSITPEESEELRQEASSYYLRYLCFFKLEEFERAARDTSRNLRVLDLMMHHTETDEDRLSLEQYRPYIMMMNARARASMALKMENQNEAAQLLEDTIGGIKSFYSQMEKEFEGLEAEGLIESSEELVVLEEMLRAIRGDKGERDSGRPVERAPFPELHVEEPVLEEDSSDLPNSVVDSLKEEMRVAVEEEDYGKAASLRDRIKALEKVIHRHHGGHHG